MITGLVYLVYGYWKNNPVFCLVLAFIGLFMAMYTFFA